MSKKANATLGEILGRKGAAAHSRGIELTDLPDLLGEEMPHLPHDPVGRARLVRALIQRFGQNYRSKPGVQQILHKFDSAIKTAHDHYMIKKKFGRK